jgi:type IV pilus assembly protein PilB
MEGSIFKIPTKLLQLITSEQAHQYRIIPVVSSSDEFIFKTDAEESRDYLQELAIVLGKKVVLQKESSKNMEIYLQKNYRKRTKTAQQSALRYSEDFLLNIIHEAKEIGSSDIHFEAF